MTTKTVVKEFRTELKLFSGTKPFAERSRELSKGLNFTLFAKSSMPRRAKVNMNRKSNIEKYDTSMRVLDIVLRSRSSRFHLLASLNTLNSLNPRNVVMTLLVPLVARIDDIVISVTLAITTMQSKIL